MNTITTESPVSLAGRSDWTVSRLAAYQVAPGVAALVLYIPIVLLLADTGIPRMVALFVGILLGEVPLSWYLMHRVLRAEGRSFSKQNLFPWRTRIKASRLLLIGVPMALLSMVIVFGMAQVFEAPIRDALFSWVPERYILLPGPTGMEGSSRTGLILLWALSGAGGVLVGGFTQELYARGFLLPRSAHLGWKSVPLNALFFAMLHLAAPWGWPFFFTASLLWAAAVYKWKSVSFGLVGHIGMLAIGWVMMTLMVFGVFPV